MANIKFTASYNGKIIDTRRSPRPYKFAIVVQYSREASRKAAHEYALTKTDRSNFEYETQVAAFQPGVSGTIKGDRPFTTSYTAEAIARAQEMVAGGIDGYLAILRKRAIERFEAMDAKGHFEPKVHGWSMSEGNAQKMANAVSGVLLAIVPAVEG